MSTNLNNIAIIPARSGSKGLKDKNIKLLNGKPLMAYTIEAALQSKKFSTVMVSTDSEQYAQIAREWGAEVPFLRLAESSSDIASSWSVVREVLSMYKDLHQEFDCLALLQPTTPLREASEIVAGFKLMEEKQAGAVVSVCEAEHSLTLYNTLPADHSFVGFLTSPEQYARQMGDTYYRLNGALYISRVDHFQSHQSIYDENCYALIMPQEHSIDIDSQFDFSLASFLLSAQEPGGGKNFF